MKGTQPNGALPIGTILHSPNQSYRVVDVLGHGGFGITYKVSAETEIPVHVGNITQTKKVRMDFAIKEFFMSDFCERDENHTVCYSNPLRDKVEGARQDFLTEARRLNVLCTKSSHIVKVNEVFEANNTAYYVMEYLDGGSLTDYVKRRGVRQPLSWDEARNVIVPIAYAVNLLHGEKLLHMDIKPDNIMLKHDGHGHLFPVLIDFGIAKHFDAQGHPTSHLSAKGASDGYAPAEQYIGITAFSPEIDVYALGATMLYMLTAKHPPKAGDIRSSQTIVELLPEAVSMEHKKAIANAMCASKYERTPNVIKFLESLGAKIIPEPPKPPKEPDDVKNTIIIDPKPNPKPEPTPNPLPKPKPHKGCIIALVLLLTGGLMFFCGNDDTDVDESSALTEAIVNSDGEKLRYYAELDSVRAFYPFALWSYSNGDTSLAKEYAQKVLYSKSGKDSLKAQSLLDSVMADIEMFQNPLEEVVENKTSSKDVKRDRKSESVKVQNVAKGKNDETSSSKTLTNEQKYNKAIEANDKATLKSLASKGYVKAYSKVASVYLKEDNYGSADTYARRALKANVGRNEAINVIEILDGYGYYDNGEHGGKPQY